MRFSRKTTVISFRVSGDEMYNAMGSRNSAPMKGALISLRLREGRAVGCEAYCSAGHYVLHVLIPLMESIDWSRQTVVHHMDVTVWSTTNNAIQVHYVFLHKTSNLSSAYCLAKFIYEVHFICNNQTVFNCYSVHRSHWKTRTKLNAMNINVILGDFSKSQNKGVEIDGTQNRRARSKEQ